mgnify:CR=1 FL=1
MANAIVQRTLADRLYRTRYEPDPNRPHIRIDRDKCRSCASRTCVHICPAEVYRVDPNDASAVAASHENCLECGTCREVCPHDAIAWTFPDGGRGVKYRFG